MSLCAPARRGSAPVSGRSVQNLAKVLTQGELFKLKLAGKLLIAGEERSVPQTSPKSSGWGSELLANCNGGLDPDGKGCRLAGEESAGTAYPAPCGAAAGTSLSLVPSSHGVFPPRGAQVRWLLYVRLDQGSEMLGRQHPQPIP